MRMDKGKPFMDIREDGSDRPTFSESFLYEKVGKYEGRFILGVAEEYEHIIKALGPKAVRSILTVKPRLAQRLGIGEKVTEWMADAQDDRAQDLEAQHPSQVILDDDSAHAVWKLLHDEYSHHFNPEESMDRNHLRAYNTLTDNLGHWEHDARQKERDRLPEKLKKQEERKTQLAARKQQRQDTVSKITQALDQAQGDHFRERRDGLAPDTAYLARQVERALRQEAA